MMHVLRTILMTTSLLAGVACAFGPHIPGDGSEAPLTGEALNERQLEMQRALRDMGHFHATFQALIRRHDSRGFSAFDYFLDGYLSQHLDRILGSEWQSRHPELRALDASLRLQKADALALMRYPRRLQREIEEIERRFSGRDRMIIEYPVGHPTTLREALTLISERKWNA